MDMHKYTYMYEDIRKYIDILTYTYIYIHMHAHAGRKHAAFRNTHTYTYIHTVTISSHSFVAAQLGFAAPSLRWGVHPCTQPWIPPLLGAIGQPPRREPLSRVLCASGRLLHAAGMLGSIPRQQSLPVMKLPTSRACHV